MRINPTPEMMEEINSHVGTPMTEEDVFVFENRMIDTLPVSHGFSVHPNLLETFTEDISKGVGLLLSHNSSKLPVGLAFKSEIRRERVEGEEGLVDTLYGLHYIPVGERGRNTTDNVTTDDIAASIDDGTVKYSSIGFNFSSVRCNVCNDNYRYCSHWMGSTYEVEDNGVIREVVCTPVAGEDGEGRLLENSLVYSGASRRAGIVGRLSEEGNDSKLENMPTLELADGLKGVPNDELFYVQNSDGESAIFITEEAKKKQDEFKAQLQSKSESKLEEKDGGEEKMGKDNMQNTETLADALLKAKEDLSEKVDEVSKLQSKLQNAEETLTEKDTEISELVAELEAAKANYEELETEKTELEGQLKVIDEIKEELTEEVLEAGVRANGNAFNKDLWTEFIADKSIKELQDILESFEGDIKEKFKAGEGGRVSKSEGEALSSTPGKNANPTYKDEFESEAEFNQHIAQLAQANCEKDASLNIAEETRRLYVKYSSRE